MSNNLERLKKLQAAAQQDELTEQELAKKEIKKLTEILVDDKNTQCIYIRSFDCKVAYKPLTVEAFSTIADIKDNAQMIKEILFLLFHGADSSVTREQIDKIPLNVASEVVQKVVNTTFLG